MFSALYTIIINPLVQITEFFYQLFYEITDNQGAAVIGLSFIVTFLTLPLYMVAEKWQEKERTAQAKLKPGIDRIKAAFKGDEQYMILSEFYRQNHYHPIMALRSSFSLLIQIPFFIAAYNFLSELEPLKDYSFLFIKSFGEPDAAFHIGSVPINVLPIAMTLINCTAGAIYSKGHGKSEKIQIYVCALVFLVLLYNSPAGLVVYWTMNNILSLAKNIFYKLKNPRRTLYVIACTCGVFLAAAALFVFTNAKPIFRAAVLLLGIALPTAPFAAKALFRMLKQSFPALDRSPALRLRLFLASAVVLTLLAGAAVPLFLMESEPEQYFYVDGGTTPFVFILHTFLQAVGYFMLWPGCFYALFSSASKKALSLLFCFSAFFAVVNSFVFSGNYGPILPELIFMEPQKFIPPLPQILLNAICFFVIAGAVIACAGKRAEILEYASSVLAIALLAVSVKNGVSVQNSYASYPPRRQKRKQSNRYFICRKTAGMSSF
ncbi:MAG: membrane protein insertase YidC [Bacteroides sp.]|nr:membrane protein insertase YidC [Prevotella sp.]MCM1407856.1 membrane protein insertase YidC [Treponema brennaborense]MCM1469598.1 membrane protein insertase YidC [Bacteroides sp.]